MTAKTIVNVASVPQRSPFRYPGGKTWLIPLLRRWMKSRTKKPANFIEPFAGGGICSLTVAAELLAEHVIMIELDEGVAAVWETILGQHSKWLGQRIMEFGLTPESATAEFSKPTKSVRQIAFKTILKNRIFHGGIMAGGSSMLKHGENGKGILSRWYPETLQKRIDGIAAYKDRISFYRGDAFKIMSPFIDDQDATFFIDPPYTAAGKKAGARLYKHHAIDHEKLFAIADSIKGDFLMTYDNAEGVHDLAKRFKFDTAPIAMKNTHHAKMTELLIGKDLQWLRGPATDLQVPLETQHEFQFLD